MQFSMLPSKTIPDADEKLVHSQLQPNSTIHKNTNHMMGPLECENVTPQASNSIPTTCGDEPMEEKLTLTGKAKKAAVAFSGGALVVCGIPLIPFPVPIGCVMVAGGLSVLSTEFAAAQKVLDKVKEKLRHFAEYERDESKEDDLGLGFKIVDRLRTVVREKIIPLVDRQPEGKEKTVEQNGQQTNVNSGRDMYNMLSG